jgi:hypothetical protein
MAAATAMRAGAVSPRPGDRPPLCLRCGTQESAAWFPIRPHGPAVTVCGRCYVAFIRCGLELDRQVVPVPVP